MEPTRIPAIVAAAALAGLAAVAPVGAAPVIVNGGFESGFAGWARSDQLGSDGGFALQSGSSSPVNAEPVPPPTEGLSAAMTDAQAPGSHVLFQDFVATGSSGILAFDLFIGNRADRFATPPMLDFATPELNQQARVDILRPGADPFSVAAADILLSLYQTEVGDPLVQGYFSVSSDIGALLAAHGGQSLRLRFAETDNVGPFQFGVDNVRIDAAPAGVPEPGSAVLAAVALTALAGVQVRRR